ncbi:MAG: type II/IV secretion system ATPase subunit [archaeon]|nr:type II/IV secretion system ATPase subunit [archaeon]
MPLKGWLRQKAGAISRESRPYDFSGELDSFTISDEDSAVIFPELPEDIETFNIKYPLIPPFAFASIRWSASANSLVYSVIEPTLQERDQEIYDLINVGLSESLDVQLSQLKTKDELFAYLKKNVKAIIIKKGIVLRKGEMTRIMYYIFRNFVGLNEVEPLLHDPFIEDIGCDGVNIPIFILHKKLNSVKTDVMFKDFVAGATFVVKLAERCGRYISYAEPLLDGSLPDGSRVQATYSKDVTTKGPTFSIRKFSSVPFSVVDLLNYGTVSIELLAYLWYLIEHQKNILICGTTAAGKTSLLNALVSFIPPEEKVVSIEDTRELHFMHENWIPSVTRQSFGAGKEKYGEVTMFDLLKASFRQNPDYVIVGEVRGVEASVLFQGMASGHSSFSTMHAGSVDEIIQRLTTPPISLSAGLINALDLVIFVQHAGRFGINARRVREVDEISNVDVTNLRANYIKTFSWQPSSDDFREQHSLLVETLSIDYGVSTSTIKDEIRNRAKVLFWLWKNNIHDFDEVALYLSKYYQNKEMMLDIIYGKTYHTKSGIFTNKAHNSLKDKVLFSAMLSDRADVNDMSLVKKPNRSGHDKDNDNDDNKDDDKAGDDAAISAKQDRPKRKAKKDSVKKDDAAVAKQGKHGPGGDVKKNKDTGVSHDTKKNNSGSSNFPSFKV